MSTDRILDQIDTALADHTVGPDAMRSRPAEEPEVRVWIAPVGTSPDDADWEPVGHITSVDFHIDPPAIDPEFARAWQAFHEQLARAQAERARRAQAVMEAFVRAYTEAVKPAAEAASRAFAELARAVQQAGARDDHAKPAPRRDRPAWQTPYGPPRRRR